MCIGWCASIFSLKTRLGEPVLLSMGLLSPILGSTVQSLLYLEIVPSSPGRVMGLLMEALLLEMWTKDRVCAFMCWEKIIKRLDRAFSRRCSCVCQSRCSPGAMIFWHTVVKYNYLKAKMPKPVSDYLFLLSAKIAKISCLYLEYPYLKYSSWTVWIWNLGDG